MGARTFSFPTETLFGAGTLSELPSRLTSLGVNRPLVVTDGGLLGTAALTLLQDVLNKSAMAKSWTLFSGVHPNPVESDVSGGVESYRANNCDGIVAFGGGSALDVGKAIRLFIKRPTMTCGEFKWDDDWSGLAKCICIPTTAGTGSEVGRSSVIVLEKTGRKAVMFTPKLLADLVILDPDVTTGLPPKLTAATGADALTHCIESFTAPIFHPLCDGIALEGINLIVEALPRAVANGNDIEARGKMLVAAAMGAISFQKDLGATHSLAHPLSTVCKMHHGLANALCLVPVMRFNSKRKPGLYRRVGIACGLDVMRESAEDADHHTIDFIADFLKKIGLTGGLRAQGVTEASIDEMVRQAVDDPCHKTNPVPVTATDFRKLYLASL